MDPTSRLLLVDDDATYRERLARALRSHGCEVVTADRVASAIAAARDFHPTGAILDLKLNGESGLDCLEPLIGGCPGIRVLLLTGYGSIATAIEAVRKGAWDYLTKPADAEQILAALRSDPSSAKATLHYHPPSLERLEWEHIQRVLNDHDGNISRAADALGLHRRSLQRKLRKYPPSY